MQLAPRRWYTPLFVGLLLAALASGVYVGYYSRTALVPLRIQDEDREKYQRPNDVLKALEISAGDWVADVGAGNGYYAQHMADLVGPTGKVFAEDIADSAIRSLRQKAKMFNLENVEIVKGTDDDPRLPANFLAAVLVMNAYHHFTRYEAMLKSIFGSLKPGGRLVIGDYSLADHRGRSRSDQLKIHEIDPALVTAEVQRVGFQVAKCETPFMKRMPNAKTGYRIGAADMWLMVAVRPK